MAILNQLQSFVFKIILCMSESAKIFIKEYMMNMNKNYSNLIK